MYTYKSIDHHCSKPLRVVFLIWISQELVQAARKVLLSFKDQKLGFGQIGWMARKDKSKPKLSSVICGSWFLFIFLPYPCPWWGIFHVTKLHPLVCLEKILQEFGARKHSFLCISGYYSCEILKQCQRIHRCLLSCWGIGNGQGREWGWRGLQNLTRLWCWTDTIHLGPSMAYFQPKKCMLPRWPTLSFPIWKVNDFIFF